MALRTLAVVALLATGAGAVELTSANWDAETAGKGIFVKFLAPWCGHCKSLKPDWDTLMDEFKGNPNALIADVDCTADGKELCEKHEVRGYPTIKYGDPGDLKDYNGARSLEELRKFAQENLGPTCGPEHLDLCDEATKAKVEKFLTMTADRLEGKIRNAIKVLEEEVPIMKKVMAHMKKQSGAKGEEL